MVADQCKEPNPMNWTMKPIKVNAPNRMVEKLFEISERYEIHSAEFFVEVRLTDNCDHSSEKYE